MSFIHVINHFHFLMIKLSLNWHSPKSAKKKRELFFNILIFAYLESVEHLVYILDNRSWSGHLLLMLDELLHLNWPLELWLMVLPFVETFRDHANGWKMMNPKMDADQCPAYETDAHHLDLETKFYHKKKKNQISKIAVFKTFIEQFQQFFHMNINASQCTRETI